MTISKKTPSLNDIIAAVLRLAEEARLSLRLRWDPLDGVRVRETPGEILDALIAAREAERERRVEEAELAEAEKAEKPKQVEPEPAEPEPELEEEDDEDERGENSIPLSDAEKREAILELAHQLGQLQAPDVAHLWDPEDLASKTKGNKARRMLKDMALLGQLDRHGDGPGCFYTLPGQGKTADEAKTEEAKHEGDIRAKKLPPPKPELGMAVSERPLRKPKPKVSNDEDDEDSSTPLAPGKLPLEGDLSKIFGIEFVGADKPEKEGE